MEVLSEFAKYAFSVLKRKSRNFERSVLKYVGIKISALTHSGWKRRFCVNAGDRLFLSDNEQNFLCIFQLSPATAPKAHGGDHKQTRLNHEG